MHVRLHERVLHRLVGVGRIAQIVERDADRAALMPRDQLGVPLARRIQPSGRLQGLHVHRHAGVRFFPVAGPVTGSC